jgi:GMP synthase-like glutamine amidotransferase
MKFKVLILNMYNKPDYTAEMEKNLAHWHIPFETDSYARFDAIDFSRYSHIMLTGSEFFVPERRVLSRDQVQHLLNQRKPVLAQCYAFHLLVYYYSAPSHIGTFTKNKHHEYATIKSPLTPEPPRKYLFNHWNYVRPAHLDADQWDIISVSQHNSVCFVVDAVMKHHPVLCLQYHPESSAPENYDFVFKWLFHNF